LAVRVGAKVEAAFLRSIVQETLTVVALELVDYGANGRSGRVRRSGRVLRRLPARHD